MFLVLDVMGIKRVRVLSRESPRTSGTVWKGQAKGAKGAGATLGEKLRFRGTAGWISRTIARAYDSTVDSLGDVIVERLVIFAGHEDPDKTFKTSMREWSKRGLVRECDRHTIKSELRSRQDLLGQTVSNLVSCNSPCPLRDEESLGTSCPHGCKQEGLLVFYIPEILAKGIGSPCTLTTHSWLDIGDGGVEDQLTAIAEEFGSIKLAPPGFTLGQFGRRLPLVLTRHKATVKRPVLDPKTKIQVGGQEVAKRTGGKADMETWPLAIGVHPQWRTAYYAWQQIQSGIALGHSPDLRLLQSAGIASIASQGEFVDPPEVKDPPRPLISGSPESCLASHPAWQKLRASEERITSPQNLATAINWIFDPDRAGHLDAVCDREFWAGEVSDWFF